MFGIFLIPFIIFIVLFYYLSKSRNENHPPGPRGNVIFGVQFEVQFETLYLKLYEWSSKYGDIFQFNLMGKTFVSLNSSEALRDAFYREPNATITAARPPTFAGKYLYDNYSAPSFASPSQKWIKQRKFHHEFLHAYGEGLKEIEDQIQCNLRHLKEELISFQGCEQNPSEVTEEFIFNTVEIMLIGRAFGKEGELQKLMRKYDALENKIVNHTTDFLLMTFPFLRYLPLPMSGLLKEYNRTKQQKNEEHNPQGILKQMKKAVNDNKKLDNPWFTEKNMFQSTFALIAAAFLTRRGTLVSMIQLLAKRPVLQEELQQEVDSIIGPEKEPSLCDRRKCPLSEAVILETLRYISHIPLSLLHQTTKPCTIKGYNIEKGTTIIPNLWTIHHCEKDWGDPFNFRPHRFLDEKGHLLSLNTPERKGLHVFGLGKRSCVGEVFARSRIFLFLATLMQSFTILEPECKNLPDLVPSDMIPGITLQPRPYKVKFVRRSNEQ